MAEEPGQRAERVTTKMRVLLTSKEFEQLARELVEELHKIPLYAVDEKRKLCSNYLKKIESTLIGNISKLKNNQAESVIAQINDGHVRGLLTLREFCEHNGHLSCGNN